MNIGIDAIAFTTSRYLMPLEELARRRQVDYQKYCIGLGQTEMAVFPPNEDIVTLGIAAAKRAIQFVSDKDSIDLVIFATESSFDVSKSAGIYVHHFLDLSSSCRVFDIKQACYSLTAALQMAKNHVQLYPKARALVIGSDIVHYELDSAAEPTQGGGAVAIVVSENPRIMRIEPFSGLYTTDVMDFWRPVKKDEALVDGKLSTYTYMKSLEICYEQYKQLSGLDSEDLSRVCFHTPFTKMARKANNLFFSEKNIDASLLYNTIIGNSCSASLYIALISLLDNTEEDLSEKRIGLFSYGSGSMAEFFSGTIVAGYRDMLTSDDNKKMLASREHVTWQQYRDFRANKQPVPADDFYTSGDIRLEQIEEDKRIYSIRS